MTVRPVHLGPWRGEYTIAGGVLSSGGSSPLARELYAGDALTGRAWLPDDRWDERARPEIRDSRGARAQAEPRA
mgnify:CR=1 FL=1